MKRTPQNLNVPGRSIPTGYLEIYLCPHSVNAMAGFPLLASVQTKRTRKRNPRHSLRTAPLPELIKDSVLG
jgi:hypothetical protein